tara:strand:- start:7957 stop:8385 length:429 start_codon:yes stop_codon:yes gene_type:complete
MPIVKPKIDVERYLEELDREYELDMNQTPEDSPPREWLNTSRLPQLTQNEMFALSDLARAHNEYFFDRNTNEYLDACNKVRNFYSNLKEQARKACDEALGNQSQLEAEAQAEEDFTQRALNSEIPFRGPIKVVEIDCSDPNA